MSLDEETTRILNTLKGVDYPAQTGERVLADCWLRSKDERRAQSYSQHPGSICSASFGAMSQVMMESTLGQDAINKPNGCGNIDLEELSIIFHAVAVQFTMNGRFSKSRVVHRPSGDFHEPPML